MKELLQELIVDFQKQPLKIGIPRKLDMVHVSGKASVCIGVRRCGKSTYLFQRINHLLEKGVSKENILYLNLFDDRLYDLRYDQIGLIVDAYYGLYPHKRHKETVYCFFDEIQSIPNWALFIERLLRTEQCEVYLTGSSAHMLSKEIATEMRGRSLSWELFPFSFQEFLEYKGILYSSPHSSTDRFFIEKEFQEYVKTGGFPEVVSLESHVRTQIHQEYFQAVLFKDLIERHNVSHPQAVNALAHWLLNNIGSLYSINKLTAHVKALGFKITKEAVSDYVAWFEDAYFFLNVPLFDASVRRVQTNPKKVYCIDHGLMGSLSLGILLNSGHVLENMVCTALRRTFPDVFYYKTRKGLEVDFVVQRKDRSKALVQVCETLVNEKTYKREAEALSDAMKELSVQEGIIVTKSEQETLSGEYGTIRIMPAWKFLLEKSFLYTS